MHTFLSLPPLLLLSCSRLVGSIPVQPEIENRAEEVLVRDYNTLNATSWNGQQAPELSSNATTRTTGTFANGTVYTIDTPSKDNSTGADTNVSGTGRLIPFPPASIIAAANRTSINSSRLPADADEMSKAAANGVLTLSIVNKWPSENLNVYVSGLDMNGALVMLGKNGKYMNPNTNSATPVPVTGDIAIPVGKPNSTLTLTLPGYIESSRVWIVDGTLTFYVVATPNGPGLVEPAAVNAADSNSPKNYGFAELSYAAAYGIYADITAVDFVGLPLGIELEDAGNKKQSILGTPSNGAAALCDKLKDQAKKDKQPWDQLCANVNNKLVRVLAPSNLISQKPDAFKGYYTRYVNNAWNKFSKQDLIIDTQTDAGKVACRVKGDQLQCAGDNRGYAKPNDMDIFGCNTGPFGIRPGDNGVHLAVVPRLCAAFNRGTLFLKGGDVQPELRPKDFYRTPKAGPNSGKNAARNWYSKFVHDIEDEGRGYAFAYDDVTARPEDDQSGLVSSTSPKVLRIIVGGT